MCIGSLFYFDNPKKCIKEMHRLLKQEKSFTKYIQSTSNHEFASAKSRDDSNNRILKVFDELNFQILSQFSYGFETTFLKNMYLFIPKLDTNFLYNILTNLKEKKKDQ